MPRSKAKQDRAFLADVEEFCRSRLAEHIYVDDLARLARMNRYQFSRKFKQARGLSPLRYLTTLRLEKALHLVSTADIQVKEIAFLCGFSEANYFSKVFRRNFGVSPGSYKARGLKAAAPTDAVPKHGAGASKGNRGQKADALS